MMWERRNNMEVTVTIADEDLDAIIIEELKHCYMCNREPIKIDNSHNVIEPDTKLLEALDLVMDYYMTREQVKNWEWEKKNR